MNTDPYRPEETQPSGKPIEGGPASTPQAQPRNPYEFNAQGSDPYSTPQPATYTAPQPQQYQAQYQPKAGMFGTGFSFEKNIVPNPLTNGLPPVKQKSAGAAYALWFLLGFLGVHQFYLGNNPRGLFHLALWAVTGVLSLSGLPFTLVYLAYWIYDAVVLSEQTTEINTGFIRKSVM